MKEKCNFQIFAILQFCGGKGSKIGYPESNNYDKLYVTKPDFGRNIGGLYVIKITHFIVSVNTSP